MEAVWSAIVNFIGSVVNFVVRAWNAFVGAVLGPAIEMVKNVVTLEVNFVVDTIWNVIIQPILPKTNDFSLSSEYQNFLTIFSNQATTNNWSSSMHAVVDPFISGLPNTNINLGNSQGLLESFSNDFGILSLISGLTGMDEVNWAINALINRTTDYLHSWIISGSQNTAVVDSFANQHSGSAISTDQLQSVSNQATPYQKLGLSPLSTNSISIPSSSNLNIVSSVIDSGTTELTSVVGDVASNYGQLITLGPVGIAIIAAVLVEGAFATSIVMDYLLMNTLIHFDLNHLLDLPGDILSGLGHGLQIILTPQSAQDQVIRDIACIQASKMGIDTFLFINGNFQDNTELKFSLATAQTLVFALGGWYFSMHLAIDEAVYHNEVVPDLFQMPIEAFVNAIAFSFCILWNLAGLAISMLKVINGAGSLTTQILGGVQLLCAFLAWLFSTWLTGSYKKLNSVYSALIFLTSISSYAMKIYFFYCNIADTDPTSEPYVLYIVSLVATTSDYVQAFNMYLNIL